jgi:hypothetical protein
MGLGTFWEARSCSSIEKVCLLWNPNGFLTVQMSNELATFPYLQ